MLGYWHSNAEYQSFVLSTLKDLASSNPESLIDTIPNLKHGFNPSSSCNTFNKPVCNRIEFVAQFINKIIECFV